MCLQLPVIAVNPRRAQVLGTLLLALAVLFYLLVRYWRLL